VSPAWMNPGLANGGARSRNHKKMRLQHGFEERNSRCTPMLSAHLLDRKPL
jgi:hypothetical protein